jgi:hypothetical protein
VAFLTKETGEFASTIEKANAEKVQAQPEQENQGTWRGKCPHLRLIHCLIEDDIKGPYLRCADAITREQLDGRNSESRPPTVWEMVAERWNSPTFNPITKVSSFHSDFASSIDCSHAAVASLTPATALKVENLLTSWRTNLCRIIQKWEQSGQGEGGHHSDSDDDETNENLGEDLPSQVQVQLFPFGGLRDRSVRALQNRSNFLRDRYPSYLLYFWELADEHQILTTTMQQIARQTAAADAANPPTTARPSSRGSTLTDDSGLEKIATAVTNLCNTQEQELKEESRRRCQDRIANLRKDLRSARREKNDREKAGDYDNAALDQEIKDILEQISEEQLQLQTPRRSDRTSSPYPS